MQEENLYTYYLVLKKYLWLIIANIVLVTGLTAYAVFYLIEPVYEAEASAIIPQKNSSVSNLFSSLGVDIADLPLKNMSFVNNANNTADFVSILKSRYITEKVVKNLKIEKHPELVDKKDSSLQASLEIFMEQVQITAPSPKDSAIRVTARFKDKQMAERVVNRYFTELKNYLEETNYLSASKNRKFIELQLSKAEKELKETEIRLLEFKKANNTVSLPDEVREYLKYTAELEAQQLSSRLELKEVSERITTAGQLTSGFNQNWSDLIKEMEIAREALKTREVILTEAKNKYLRLLNGLPAKAFALARLERELKVQNALYLFLTQQFEAAKLEEARETEPFQMLDEAFTYARPVFPKKTLIITAAFILSLLSAIFFSFFLDYWEKLKHKHQRNVVFISDELIQEKKLIKENS